MVKGLHVIDRRVLQLMNKYSIYTNFIEVFSNTKKTNLGVLYAPLGQSLCLQFAFCKALKEKFSTFSEGTLRARHTWWQRKCLWGLKSMAVHTCNISYL